MRYDPNTITRKDVRQFVRDLNHAANRAHEVRILVDDGDITPEQAAGALNSVIAAFLTAPGPTHPVETQSAGDSQEKNGTRSGS